MALDDQDIIPIIEQAIGLLKSAAENTSGTNPFIVKQLNLATEMSERCVADLRETKEATKAR
jgi:hypothetical protein